MIDDDRTSNGSSDPSMGLLWAWKTSSLPRLDGGMTREQGLAALNRLRAYAQWASSVLERNQDTVDVEVVLRQLTAVHGIIENIRVDDARTGDRELINSVVLCVEQCASSLVAASQGEDAGGRRVEDAAWVAEANASAVEAAVHHSIEMAEAMAPNFAEVLRTDQDALRRVIIDFKSNKRRKAIGDLIRMLDPTKKRSKNKALYETFKEWDQRRDERLPRRGAAKERDEP